jgi:hypothetical protein
MRRQYISVLTYTHMHLFNSRRKGKEEILNKETGATFRYFGTNSHSQQPALAHSFHSSRSSMILFVVMHVCEYVWKFLSPKLEHVLKNAFYHHAHNLFSLDRFICNNT